MVGETKELLLREENLFVLVLSPSYFLLLLVLYGILGAFSKLWNAFISFILFVSMEQLGSHLTDFYDMWYLRLFLKSVEKIQVSLNSDKNNG